MILNGIIAAVAVFLAVSLIRDLTHSRPIPPSAGARAKGAGPSTEGAVATPAPPAA